jgi:hypothetical protein
MPLPKEDLLGFFELTSYITTSKMHLISEEGIVKKFEDVADIMREFFHLRSGIFFVAFQSSNHIVTHSVRSNFVEIPKHRHELNQRSFT